MQPTLILETTAYTLEQLAHLEQDQVALAGRSNVGKSSLVNALAGRKALAKVSASPGKTRSINFYKVSTEDFFVVDLPGYGYARCSKEERNKWAKLLERYLVTCTHLKALALLLDCRLPPQNIDVALAQFAQAHDLPLLPILTKADKCNQRERNDQQRVWKGLLGGLTPIITSARDKQGITDLWTALHGAVYGEKEQEEPSPQSSSADA
ncbi:MAG: ribosome biogenesis GTP-binding protein YihA/YsxC [Desulfovibrionaceae bacterium]